MSKVFANGREISGKATGTKSIAAMPDVCMSPPSPPAGPVPIPYPNTAVAADTAGGSKTVKVKGKEVGLKNASTYKKSTGNEPATNSFGAGVVSHKIQGAMRNAAWSFDVKIEGQNALRHMDLTTHNHANPANGATGPLIGGIATSDGGASDCKSMAQKNSEIREEMSRHPNPEVRKVGGAPPANAIAQASVNGGPPMIAASRHKVLEPYSNGKLKKGLEAKAPARSNRVCPGDPYQFEDTEGAPAHLHAEARLLESVPTGPGRPNVTLAINWATQEGTKIVPCKYCENLIKHACKCMSIEICDDEGYPRSRCEERT